MSPVASQHPDGRRSVAVVDDLEAARDEVVRELERHPERFGPVTARSDAAELGPGALPDVVVLELPPRRAAVRTAVREIARLVEAGVVVVLFTLEDRPVPLREARHAGISALVLRSDGLDALVRCLAEADPEGLVCSSAMAQAMVLDMDRTPLLSDRLVEVLRALSAGASRARTAAHLGIGEDTLRDYVTSIRDRYARAGRRVASVQSLVREARRDGYLD